MKYIFKDLLTNEENKYKEGIFNKYELMHDIGKYIDIQRPFQIYYDYEEIFDTTDTNKENIVSKI